jgi:hypothetical protein
MTPELYPTAIRATGHGVCYFVSRFGALSSPYMVESTLPNVVIGVLICLFDFIAVFFTYSLPETSGIVHIMNFP